MNRNRIYISYCMAAGALLLSSLTDQANAACDPPRDVSSCYVLPKAKLTQASAALPQAPFLVSDSETGNTLVMTYFNDEVKPAAPGKSDCKPSNVSGCATISSVELTSSAIAKKSTPFVVRFPDGRSLLASPMASR